MTDPTPSGAIPVANAALPRTTSAVVDGVPTTVDPTTGQPTTKPTSKVLAGAITAGALVVVEAAIAAITPDLFSGLGPWGGVVFAGVVGLGGFLAGYIKKP